MTDTPLATPGNLFTPSNGPSMIASFVSSINSTIPNASSLTQTTPNVPATISMTSSSNLSPPPYVLPEVPKAQIQPIMMTSMQAEPLKPIIAPVLPNVPLPIQEYVNPNPISYSPQSSSQSPQTSELIQSAQAAQNVPTQPDGPIVPPFKRYRANIPDTLPAFNIMGYPIQDKSAIDAFFIRYTLIAEMKSKHYTAYIDSLNLPDYETFVKEAGGIPKVFNIISLKPYVTLDNLELMMSDNFIDDPEILQMIARDKAALGKY
jgi:hypothetical protein